MTIVPRVPGGVGRRETGETSRWYLRSRDTSTSDVTSRGRRCVACSRPRTCTLTAPERTIFTFETGAPTVNGKRTTLLEVPETTDVPHRTSREVGSSTVTGKPFTLTLTRVAIHYSVQCDHSFPKTMRPDTGRQSPSRLRRRLWPSLRTPEAS